MFIPVSTTIPFPLPYVIKLEENNRFVLSPTPTSCSSIFSVCFSTAKDSPVKAASCDFKLTASIILKSAGIKSPVSKITISPGTNSADWTTTNFPFLITLATWLLIFWSASKDFSALFSWATPIIAFTTTTIKIIIESVNPSPSLTPTIPETTAAIIRIIIIKSLNCSMNFSIRVFFLLAFNSFVPYFSLLAITSASERPLFKSVSNFFAVSSAVKLYQFSFSIFSSLKL